MLVSNENQALWVEIEKLKDSFTRLQDSWTLKKQVDELTLWNSGLVWENLSLKEQFEKLSKLKEDQLEELTLGLKEMGISTAGQSSIQWCQSPDKDSLIDKILMNSNDYFNLSNVEHKMIISSLKEEIAKPFIFKAKYY